MLSRIYTSSSKKKFFVLIVLLILVKCNVEQTIHLQLPYDKVKLQIESVSPNGQYLFVNIYDMPESLTVYNIPQPAQVVVDLEHRICWTPLDTNIYKKAKHISWSADSKKAIFSVFRRARRDSSLPVFFPICVYNMHSRQAQVIEKPRTPYRGIPQFYPEKHRIVFWTPTILSDTLEGRLWPPWGHIFMLDTIRESLTEVRKGRDIARAHWMQIYDTTLLYIAVFDTTSTDIASYILWSIDLSSGDAQQLLPDTRVISGIRTCNDRIVFNGIFDKDTIIHIYNLEKRNTEVLLEYHKGTVLSACINTSDDLAIETTNNNYSWIYVVSMRGITLDSLRGHSPYWLDGSDSLVYAEGKRIYLAYWHDDELKKKSILEVIR